MNRYLKVSIIVLLALAASSPVPTSLSAHVAPTDYVPYEDYDPNVLSYGIYWFGLDNANQKFVPGETNAYFDPTKPTVIFVHGWQPGISATYPPNFSYALGGGVNTANAWVNAGWNIGIFFWNQFSDETLVTDAEAKIWVNDGPQGMRWRKGDGSYEQAPPGTPSAGELFYQAYVSALTEHEYTGGNIRIAGHSLGNQMATRLTELVHDGIAAGTVPKHLRPTRVALLDPYWSIGEKTYLDGQETGGVIREYIATLLPTGMLFEWYWSSVLTVNPNGDTNEALKPMMMYAEMSPDFATDNMSKHCAAWNLYFWSYAFDGPSECVGSVCLGMDKLLAKMSDAQLATVMRSDYVWQQDAGSLTGSVTATPEDDVYQSYARSDAPYTISQLTASSTTPSVGDVITLTATVEGKDSAQVEDGTLVTFGADLGDISARSATSGGVAIAHLDSTAPGTAHVTATTQGSGGIVQSTVTVTFSHTCLTDVSINGPLGVTGTLYMDTLYTFDAVITPTNASPPITYTWTPTPTNGQNHASAVYRWPTPGTYTITLTAENCGEAIEAAPRVVNIAYREEHYVYLPLVLRGD